VSFMRDTLSEEFFVLDKHRERFSSNGHGSRRYNWRIVSVEESDLVEEVFCATVDGTKLCVPSTVAQKTSSTKSVSSTGTTGGLYLSKRPIWLKRSSAPRLTVHTASFSKTT